MTPKPVDFYTKVPPKPKDTLPPTEELEDTLLFGFPFLTPIQKPTKGFYGRENEVNEVMESMMKKRMKNCVIVGDAGIGKTEIARKAIEGIRDMGIFLNLDLSILQSGCTLVGQFEQKINDLLHNVATWKTYRPTLTICFFIDEVHSLWNLNKHDKIGTVPAGDILKPYLADGIITIIGTTTKDEYEKYVKPDKALLRRISPVFVNPINDKKTLKKILKHFCEGELSEQLIDRCIESSTEISYLHNPDASIEIADRVMARAIFRKKIADEKDVDEIVKTMQENSPNGEV